MTVKTGGANHRRVAGQKEMQVQKYTAGDVDSESGAKSGEEQRKCTIFGRDERFLERNDGEGFAPRDWAGPDRLGNAKQAGS